MGRALAVGRGLAAGAALWTLVEYSVHRWVMHGSHTGNPLTAEHLDHHRHLERTDPLRFDRFLLWPLAGGLAVTAPAALVASLSAAAGAGVGFAASYCGYRQIHWSIHHRPPLTRWGRHLRRHHLAHHVGAPRANHGVTTDVWDRLLGTRRHPGPVRLPAAMAPPWLVADGGQPPPHLRRHFVVR